MVAALRKMQENQRFSEIRIDKYELVEQFFQFVRNSAGHIVRIESWIVVSQIDDFHL